MSENKPFTPGFETAEQAIKAGQEFFAKTNGKKGVEGRDFHLVTNKHGRWHFEDGPGAKTVDWSRQSA